MDFLGRLTSSRVVRGVAKKLHIDAILRPAYRRMTAPAQVVTVGPLGLSHKMRLDPQELSNYEQEFAYGERDFLEALKTHLHPGEIALDVGAHLGEFTLPLSMILGTKGRVLSFEPEEHAYQRLLDHLKLNGVTNVQTFDKALGDEEKTDRIYFGGGFCPSIVPLKDDEIRRSASIKIEIVQGDNFIERERLPLPHAVKIDVEGFEYAVLRGLSRTLASPTCRLICMEVHPEALPSGISAETITDLLRSFGFADFRIEQRTTEIHVVALKSAHNV